LAGHRLLIRSKTMKNDRPISRLRELSWRRKLTETEAAELCARIAAEPGARGDWEVESALNAALDRLPDTPVPSNFTARVMQAVEREAARPRAWSWNWNWHVLVPRLAIATAVVVLGGLMLHQHNVRSQRVALVKSVALVAGNQPVPSPEALENFDAIRRMSRPHHADDELLALMQ
jgi:negative regulator of sigma E activity